MSTLLTFYMNPLFLGLSKVDCVDDVLHYKNDDGMKVVSDKNVWYEYVFICFVRYTKCYIYIIHVGNWKA